MQVVIGFSAPAVGTHWAAALVERHPLEIAQNVEHWGTLLHPAFYRSKSPTKINYQTHPGVISMPSL